MANEMTMGKRLFSIAVVAMTILWTVGAGLAPLSASAVSSGDLVRGTSFSTVYYYGSDGMRYTFPNEKAYFSWYSDFSGVSTISDAELAAIPLGGNATYRPGSYWVKIQSDPKVYAVSPNGSLHWIESEAVAEALYGGSGWNTFIQDVPDAFFADYSIGASLASADMLFDGALVSSGGSTYLVWDGMKRMVSSAGMSANGLQSMYVLSTSVDVSAIADGSELSDKSDEISDVAQMLEGDGSSSAGGLNVSLASSTPAGATLPQGANGVEVARFQLTATDGDATLNSIAARMGGIGATTDVSNAYLYEGTERLTEARSVNASTREVVFSNIGFAVANGETRYLSVVVELLTTATAADTLNFGLLTADSVGSDATVSGSFPAVGNTFSISGNAVGSITIAKSGSITNPSLGQQDAIVGQFLATAGTEDVSIERMRIKVDNASDHSDFGLYQASTKLSTGVYASGDFVDFELDTPYVIPDGNNKIFAVKMDVGGQAADAVDVYLDKDTDVIGVGGDYGFNVSVTRNGYDGGSNNATEDGGSCTATTDDCSYSTIQGGDVTIAFNGPSSGDYQVNSQDNVLLAFSITSQQDVTVKDFDIIVYGNDDGNSDPTDGGTDSTADDTGLIRGTTTEANLKDLKVRYADSGNTLMGPLELAITAGAGAADATQTMQFTDDFSISAGETIDLEFTADIDNNAEADNLFAAAIDVSGISIEDSNGDALTAGTDITPSGDITGNSMTIRAAALTVALASSPVSTTVVQGSSNINTVAFTMTAGVGADILISSIVLSAYGEAAASYSAGVLGGEDGAQVEDYVSSCSLYDSAGTLLDGPQGSASTGNTFTFNQMDWTIPAGTVELLDVFCNLQNPSDAGPDFFTFDLATLADDVTSVDEDGNDVDGTGDAANGGVSATVVMTVNAAGTLAVAKDSGTPSAAILLAGTSNNVVSKFKVTATNEDFEITRMSFSEEQAEDDANEDTTNGNESTYANNISSVILSYPDVSGATQTATAFMSGNEVKFDGITMYVPANSPKVVTVSVNIPGIDRDAGGSAASGEKLRIGHFIDAANDDQFRAVGQGSGSVLDDDDVSAIGDDRYGTDGISTFTIRETMPTVNLASGSPSGAKVPGLDEVLRFTVAASSNEDVVVDEIVFKVTSTDNNGETVGADWNECDTDLTTVMETSEYSLYNYTDLATELESATSDWTLLKATGAACDGTDDVDVGFAHLQLAAGNEITVAAGTTKTLSLWLDTTGASATNDDSLRIDIPSDPIIAVGSFIDSNDRLNAALAIGATTAVVDTGATRPAHGDIAIIPAEDTIALHTDEVVLVTNLGSTDTNTYISRGYLGTNNLAAADLDDMDYMPSSFVWYDDGDTTDTNTAFEDEVAGSYLVDNLPVTGGTIIY